MINLPDSIETVYSALRVAFPDAPAAPLRVERYPEHVSFGTVQSAWVDISFGWEPVADCPPQRNCHQPEYRPCPQGGRFYRSVYSIGD